MSDSWVVQNLNNALNTWNEKLAEVWELLLMSPQSFKGGGIWKVILQINGACTEALYPYLHRKGSSDLRDWKQSLSCLKNKQ